MYLNLLKKIGFRAKHNAFVDLCAFKNDFFCVYREAKNHLSIDGNICILRLDKQAEVIQTQQIRVPNCDLRDPKITVTPQGKLLLTAYARYLGSKASENVNWFSADGHSWSSAKTFGQPGWWLWRLRWHNNQAYGLAYNKQQQALDLYAGDPRRGFYLQQKSVLSLAKHNKGYPNESDLIFKGDKAYALVRRDADSFTAQLGHSQAPFKQWRWTDLGRYLGGPTMLALNQNYALVAARIVKQKKLVTALLTMHLETGHLQELMVLPSSGDNSYPGCVLEGHNLYLSYYSSHQDNKSCVYLAHIDIRTLD
ncbi:hypothetical protein [Paraglaciecola aestuariivivens]